MQVESGSGRRPAALPPRTVRILTRRPALAESLARHVSALGLTVQAGDGEDVLIVDAGSYQDHLRAYADSANLSRTALVVVASAAEVESGDLARIVVASAIVSKPVHRDALYEALSGAIDKPRLATRPLSHSTPSEPAIGGHVLLVEDEPVNAAVAQGYLSELGCTSVWIKAGPDAIARSAAERFDLILMDLSMPTMDGFAVTALIRQREGLGRRVPIIALTAHDAAGYRESCLKAGMEDLLTKPYTLEEFSRLLRRWIASSAARPPAGPSLRPELGALTSVDPAAVTKLRNLRAGKHADLYSKLVDLFRMGSSTSMTELRRALAGGDFDAASNVCHKLASSAANVGALAFAQDVRLLGQMCKAGDAARAGELHDRLEAAHPALLEELMRLQCRESA
jgi:CheY-like chemotaxis protein